MKQTRTVGNFIGHFFRYLFLCLLLVVFCLSATIWGMADHLVKGLTCESTYEKAIRDIGISKYVADGFIKLEDVMPETILPYFTTGGKPGEKAPVEELNLLLVEAVETSIAKSIGQLPAYLAGRRDSLTCQISLARFRERAVEIAIKSVPGAKLVASQVQSIVEANIPLEFTLDPYLGKVELLLLPARAAVGRLLGVVDRLERVSIVAFVLLIVFSFRLTTASRFCGSGLLLAGLLGTGLSGLIIWLIKSFLPADILNIAFVNAIFDESVEAFYNTALLWLILGAILISVSFLPVLLKKILSSPVRTSFDPLLIFIFNKRKPVDLSSTIAFIPATISYLLVQTKGYKTGRQCALFGYTIASIIWDYLLIALTYALLAGSGPLGILSKIIGFFLLGALFVYWFFRDNPKKKRSINISDKLARVIREFLPGKKIIGASLLKSAPLILATVYSLFTSSMMVFGIVALIEIIVLCFKWPNRTLGDLLGQTRTAFR